MAGGVDDRSAAVSQRPKPKHARRAASTQVPAIRLRAEGNASVLVLDVRGIECCVRVSPSP
jgi:hypothetical protein